MDICYNDYITYFRKCKKILDVGCGTGWIGRFLPGVVTGVDNSQEMLKKAAKYEKTVKAELDQTLPFKNNEFDGIIARNIIEHMTDNRAFIKEMHRILKPGGLLHMCSSGHLSQEFYNDYQHVRPYSKESFRRILQDHNFKIIDIWYTGNWPGMTIYQKISKKNSTPAILKFLSQHGIQAKKINCLALKNR